MVSPERVPDRATVAHCVVRAELDVIANQVDMGFRADEEIAEGIEADARPKVSHEMGAGGVVTAAAEVSAGIKILIKADALSADARLQLRSGVLGEAGSVDPIEVPEHGPVRLESREQILISAPGNFPADAKVVLDERVSTEVQVSSTTEALREGRESWRVVAGRRSQSADSKCRVNLLTESARCHCKQQKSS